MKPGYHAAALLLLMHAVPALAQDDHLADMLNAEPGRERSERLVMLAAEQREHGDGAAAIELATLGATEAMNHGLNDQYAEAMLELSSAQATKGLFEEAIGSALRAGMTSEGVGNGMHDRAMRKLGELYLAAGQPREALESLAAASPASDASTRAKHLSTEVRAQAMIMDDAGLIPYLKGVLDEIERIAAPALKYQVLALLADAQGASGALEEALSTEEKVTHLAIDLHLTRQAAISTNNRIVLAQRSGHNAGALTAYEQGLHLADDHADLRIAMHGNAALTYAAMGIHEKALALAQQAVREADREQGSSFAAALRTLSAVQVSNSELSEAQNTATDALEAAEDRKDLEGQLAACDLLSWILDRRNMTTEARAYDRRARELQEQRNAELEAEERHRRERAYRLQHLEMEEVGRVNREAQQEARMKEMALDAGNTEKQMKLLVYERELDAAARREAVFAREQADHALEQMRSRLQAEQSERTLKELDHERKIQILNMHKMQLEKQERQRDIEMLNERNALAEAGHERARTMRNIIVLVALGAMAAAGWMMWAWIITRRKKRTIWKQHQQITMINEQLEDRDKDIRSSLRYARTIQGAIMPTEADLHACLPESFILYKPLDVVSGDLPFVRRIGNKVFVAAIDCTGHGVPAAMMTFIAYYGLGELLQSDPDAAPGHVLDGLHQHVRRAMEMRAEGTLYNDGFDIGLCVIDLDSGALSYAGAQLPLFLVREGEVRRIKGDILPIGDDSFDRQAGYRTETVQLHDHDQLYLSSDGFIHQFGGEQQRTFSTKRLQLLLSQTKGMNMQEVKQHTDHLFHEWKGSNGQTDDVLLIGMRYAA